MKKNLIITEDEDGSFRLRIPKSLHKEIALDAKKKA